MDGWNTQVLFVEGGGVALLVLGLRLDPFVEIDKCWFSSLSRLVSQALYSTLPLVQGLFLEFEFG